MNRNRGSVLLIWLAALAILALVSVLTLNKAVFSSKTCVYGIVTDATGRPVANATVDVSVDYIGPKSKKLFGYYIPETKYLTLVTGSKGRFEVVRPWTEQYDVIIVTRVRSGRAEWKAPSLIKPGTSVANACMFRMHKKDGVLGGDIVHHPDADHPRQFMLPTSYASAAN